MPESKPNNEEENGVVRKGCKRTREHVATILPFQIIEKFVDKPMKIRGVAMTAGMNRNFNIYTPEELQAFASKLVNSPVYIEHVSVNDAVGKVAKTDWDGHKNIQNTLLYTQLISFENDEYHSATAKTVQDTQKLIEAGFEYVCEFSDVKIFRRRK